MFPTQVGEKCAIIGDRKSKTRNPVSLQLETHGLVVAKVLLGSKKNVERSLWSNQLFEDTNDLLNHEGLTFERRLEKEFDDIRKVAVIGLQVVESKQK